MLNVHLGPTTEPYTMTSPVTMPGTEINEGQEWTPYCDPIEQTPTSPVYNMCCADITETSTKPARATWELHVMVPMQMYIYSWPETTTGNKCTPVHLGLAPATTSMSKCFPSTKPLM
jgi:hypothetical protein